MAETIGTAVVKVIADGDGFAADAERQIRAHGKDFEKAGEETGKHFHTGMKKNDKKETDGRMRSLRQRLESWGPKFQKSGEKIGRAFGKGSRNDFLNAFGGFISLGPRLLGMLVELGKKFLGLGKAAENAGEDVDSFKDILLNLAKEGLPGLIAAAATAAGAIVSVVALMGPMASGIVLVTGIVLALAGSLAFALVGALAAVAGALVPFAAAIGIAALAIGGMDKKSKVFKDLKKTWKDLQKTASTAIFGKDMGGLKGVTDVLKTLKPLVKTVGGALGDLLDNLSRAAGSKDFQNWIGDVNRLLGPMIKTIGSIAGNIGTFLGEAFVAAGPIITEFLGWLDDVTGKLAGFGKPGKGGKSGLSQFFEDAWTSAKKVGRLIENIILVVGDLFGAGKGTGDSIFTSMADQVEKIHKWLTDPKNQDKISEWFADAEEVAGQIGGIVLAVEGLIAALDTPMNRSIFTIILDGITGLIKIFTTVATAWDAFWTGLVTAVIQVGEDIKTSVSDMVGDIVDQFTFMLPGITAAVNLLLGPWIWLYDQLVGNSIIPDLIDEIVRLFGTLPGLILGAIGNLGSIFAQWVSGVATSIGKTVATIAGSFAGLARKAFAKAGSLAREFATWAATLPGKAREMASKVATAFAGLAGKVIAKAGSLASRFGSWVASLPGKARSIANQAANGFAGLAGKIIAKAGNLAARFASWVASLPGKARSIANQIASAFSGLANKAIAKAGSIVAAMGHWASGVGARARGVANDIVDAFRGLASRIVAAIGTIIPKIQMPHITIPHITAIVDKPGASGFVTAGPQHRLIGEAGPEAVVPLNRPLSQVDPAVRMLSAFAQGKLPGLARGGVSAGKTIDVGGITINTPTEDPRAVASEVIAHMAAAAYI